MGFLKFSESGEQNRKICDHTLLFFGHDLYGISNYFFQYNHAEQHSFKNQSLG
jgi:hypothetical protein